MTSRIYIVIVNYNGGQHLLTCLRSIFESYQRAEVVIVDNASRDQSLEQCKKAYPKLHYIYNTHNVGFAAGVNIGMRFALEHGAETVILVNPDAVLAKDTIGLLDEALQETSVGLAVPVIYDGEGSCVWFAGGTIDFKNQKVQHDTLIESDQPYNVGFATGCVLAIDQKTCEKVGLFDERFFLYYEDADYSWRVSKNDLDIKLVPQAKVWHSEISELDMPQKTYFLVLSGLLFFEKHAQGVKKLTVFGRIFARYVYSVYKITFFPSEITRAVHKAFKDFRHAYKNRHFVSDRQLSQ